MEKQIKGMKRKYLKPYYRKYKDYSEYIEQQKSKLKRKLKANSTYLQRYDKLYGEALVNRLLNNHIPKGNILCLGARIGTEVKAFHKLGCFAVGIDLITSLNNKYVLYGDFHNLQFPNNSIDAVFTNSLDHVLDINKVLSEIKRVLKSDGNFIAEIALSHDLSTSYHGSFFWSKVDDIIDIIINKGFKLLRKTSFSYPWPGEHCVFKKVYKL